MIQVLGKICVGITYIHFPLWIKPTQFGTLLGLCYKAQIYFLASLWTSLLSGMAYFPIVKKNGFSTLYIGTLAFPPETCYTDVTSTAKLWTYVC